VVNNRRQTRSEVSFPVNVREPGSRHVDNRISAMLAVLPVDIEDLLKRLAVAHGRLLTSLAKIPSPARQWCHWPNRRPSRRSRGRSDWRRISLNAA
jgi:hypothetical protein